MFDSITNAIKEAIMVVMESTNITLDTFYDIFYAIDFNPFLIPNALIEILFYSSIILVVVLGAKIFMDKMNGFTQKQILKKGVLMFLTILALWNVSDFMKPDHNALFLDVDLVYINDDTIRYSSISGKEEFKNYLGYNSDEDGVVVLTDDTGFAFPLSQLLNTRREGNKRFSDDMLFALGVRNINVYYGSLLENKTEALNSFGYFEAMKNRSILGIDEVKGLSNLYASTTELDTKKKVLFFLLENYLANKEGETFEKKDTLKDYIIKFIPSIKSKIEKKEIESIELLVNDTKSRTDYTVVFGQNDKYTVVIPVYNTLKVFEKYGAKMSGLGDINNMELLLTNFDDSETSKMKPETIKEISKLKYLYRTIDFRKINPSDFTTLETINALNKIYGNKKGRYELDGLKSILLKKSSKYIDDNEAFPKELAKHINLFVNRNYNEPPSDVILFDKLKQLNTSRYYNRNETAFIKIIEKIEELKINDSGFPEYPSSVIKDGRIQVEEMLNWLLTSTEFQGNMKIDKTLAMFICDDENKKNIKDMLKELKVSMKIDDSINCDMGEIVDTKGVQKLLNDISNAEFGKDKNEEENVVKYYLAYLGDSKNRNTEKRLDLITADKTDVSEKEFIIGDYSIHSPLDMYSKLLTDNLDELSKDMRVFINLIPMTGKVYTEDGIYNLKLGTNNSFYKELDVEKGKKYTGQFGGSTPFIGLILALIIRVINLFLTFGVYLFIINLYIVLISKE